MFGGIPFGDAFFGGMGGMGGGGPSGPRKPVDNKRCVQRGQTLIGSRMRRSVPAGSGPRRGPRARSGTFLGTTGPHPRLPAARMGPESGDIQSISEAHD